MTPNSYLVSALAREHHNDLLREAEHARLRRQLRAGRSGTRKRPGPLHGLQRLGDGIAAIGPKRRAAGLPCGVVAPEGGRR
jgi:hypothetical protein